MFIKGSKSLQNYLVLMIFLFLGMLVGCSQSPSAWHDSQGKPIRLSDYRGKWVVINYWSSWCKPCAEEIPELNLFYFAHKDKDAVVLGYNYDHAPPSEIPMLIQRMGVLFPTLMEDPATQLGVISISGLPTSFLIGPDGKLKQTLMGEQTQYSLEQAMGLPTIYGTNA